MKQYELAIRIAQIHHLVDERKYKKALAVIQTLDMHQVRSLSDLKVFAEVYTKTEQYDAAKATYLRIYRRSRTKRVLYRLIYLSIRTNALNDAESYYQEFVRMNPNVRDSLILRYRIDKASGAPIGQLIEILQQLKQEEYIEEWAYELAKLYHRAGRKEECIEECEDILLWFGTGEIVQRAKILIDHLKEKEPVPYYDDKDFTIPKPEEPNPEDTGSLPDLDEFIREQKAQRRGERKEGRFFRKDVHADKDQEEEKKEKVSREKDVSKKEEKADRGEDASRREDEDGFIDDYEDSDFDAEGMAIPQMAKDGIQKLSDLLKFGKKEEETSGEKKEKKENKEKKESKESKQQEKKKGSKKAEAFEEPKQKPAKKAPEYVPHSQSGTGITQDLAKEITAIYEMEHSEQLREKNVTVIEEEDTPNLATDVVERMTKALQKNTKTTKTYIPLDVEEIRGDDRVTEVNGPEEITKVLDPVEEEEDLSREEITEEMFEDEEIPEKESEENGLEAEEPVEEEMVVKPEIENMTVEPQAEKTAAEESAAEETAAEPETAVRISSEQKLESILEQEVAEIQQAIAEEEKDFYAEKKAEQALEGKSDAEAIRELLEEEIEEEQDPLWEMEEEYEEKEERVFGEKEGLQAESEETVTGAEEKIIEKSEETDAGAEEEIIEKSEEIDAGAEEKVFEENVETGTRTEEEILAENKETVTRTAEETFEKISRESAQTDTEETEASVVETMEAFKEEEEIAAVSEETVVMEKAPVLEGYQAPDIPVVQTEYMEMPEINYEDLPTTRALHQSFDDIIQLIKGELDPSHFVLMGNGSDRMVGVSKKIVRAMKETSYLSQGRIAKIHARQINTMDLVSFKEQLKGNCLLIEEAADLLFPTITHLFSIMDEYYGDFVVILSDEGSTLDQLFRFVPILARKFKYIIDVSHYTPEDYAG